VVGVPDAKHKAIMISFGSGRRPEGNRAGPHRDVAQAKILSVTNLRSWGFAGERCGQPACRPLHRVLSMAPIIGRFAHADELKG
jgi:hypothetical protein